MDRCWLVSAISLALMLLINTSCFWSAVSELGGKSWELIAETAADWMFAIGLDGLGGDAGVLVAPFNWSLSCTDASTLARVTDSEVLEVVRTPNILAMPAPGASETELILSMLSVWVWKSLLLVKASELPVPLVLTSTGLPLKIPLLKNESSKTWS